MIVSAAVLAGCASAPKGPATLPAKEIATIQWSEFEGMSQDDLRQRVGMPATGATLASRAYLENGEVVSEISASRFLRGACRDAPDGYNASVDISHNDATLEMVDGRIVRMRAQKLQHGPPPDAEHPFVASCSYRRRMTHGESLNSGQAGMAVGLLPLLPAVMASKAIGDAAARGRFDALSELRLGEAPPGGLDAWIGKHGGQFVAASPADGEIELRFNTPSGRERFHAPAARIRDGRVVTLDPGIPCKLRPDHSLACDWPS